VQHNRRYCDSLPHCARIPPVVLWGMGDPAPEFPAMPNTGLRSRPAALRPVSLASLRRLAAQGTEEDQKRLAAALAARAAKCGK